MNGIILWLKHPAFGLAPTWAFVAFVAAFVLEWAIGRFFGTKPWARSLLAVLATGLRALLVVTKVAAIPLVGRGLISFLETFAGVDLDGDGRVGDKTPAPPAPPPGPLAAALFVLACLAPTLSCAHVQPVVSDFVDCAAPEVKAACEDVKPAVISALLCTGGNVSVLPACAVAQLAMLEAKHGKAIVACAAQAIRDALFLPSVAGDTHIVKARAAEYLQGVEAHGLKLRPAP